MRLILLAATLLVACAGHAVAAPRLGGQTQLSFAPGEGMQVEYLGTDGHSWLWHPGNQAVLAGTWKFEEADICFRYGAGSYDPAAGERGSNWDCVPYELYRITIVESRRGDTFALRDRKQVPFALPRKRLSHDQLQILARGGNGVASRTGS